MTKTNYDHIREYRKTFLELGIETATDAEKIGFPMEIFDPFTGECYARENEVARHKGTFWITYEWYPVFHPVTDEYLGFQTKDVCIDAFKFNQLTDIVCWPFKYGIF